VSAAVAAAIIVYGAYGDPHPKSNQEDAVPVLIVAALIASAVVFGAIVPLAMRSQRQLSLWSIGFAVVGLVSIVAFWSGAPVLLGVAAVLTGYRAREQAAAGASLSRAGNVGVWLGAFVAIAPVLITVLGNSVLAR
jgi:hypothetical protein